MFRTKRIKLRTPPIGHKHVHVGPKGWRKFPRGDRNMGPLAAPGIYTVKLSVGKMEYVQKLTVEKDPHSTGTVDDIRAQLAVTLGIREMVNQVSDIINKSEIVRKQLYDLTALIAEDKDAAPIIEQAKELDKKFIAIEGFFFSMGQTGEGDGLRWPDKFYARIRSLAFGIEASDFPPTTQQSEVYKMFKEQLSGYEKRFNILISRDLPSFNTMLAAKNILNIVAR